MKAVYLRELKSYFTSFLGYILIAFLLLAVGIYSWFVNFLNQSPYFEYVIYNLNFVFLIMVPIITMRVFAEEKKQKTDTLIYSLPLKPISVVMGKYCALVSILLIAMTIISLYPLILSLFGTISLATSYSTIIGFLFLGMTLMSVGMFISSVTDNQIVAAAVTFVVLFISYLSSIIASGVSTSAFASFVSFCLISIIIAVFSAVITKNVSFGLIIGSILCSASIIIYVMFPTLLEGAIQNILKFLSVFDRLSYFVTGVFDLTSVIYYFSLSVMFIFFTVQSLEKRRWC